MCCRRWWDAKRATCETWVEECKSLMNAWQIRTSEFFGQCCAISECGVSVQSFEVDGAAYRGSDTTVGSKDDETVVNPCSREIDKRKQAVDIKVTREVSPSGRMASVGRHVAECSVRVERDFCL